MNDLRFTLRSLLRAPAFAIAAILTLAIAIGANTAMFSVLYAVVLEPLPYRDPERMVMVWETDTHNASLREGASMPDLNDWLAQQQVFEGLAGTTNRTLNLTQRDAEAERLAASGVAANFFSLAGVKPLAGRGFIASDDKEGAEPVAILSDTLWRRRFGAREDVVGKQISLDGKQYRVVGVMPQRVSFARRKAEVWLPLTELTRTFKDVRGVHNILVVGRLKDGVTREQAQASMDVIAANLAKQYPDDNVGRGIWLEPMLDSVVRESRQRLYILGAAVLAVLLIACINVAGLMLARADSRARELAVRASLGASRARLVRQLLTESAGIAMIGGLAGIVLAWWGSKTMIALAPTLPRVEGVGLNIPVLLFALGISLVSAVFFGIVPALRASTSKPALALAGSRGVLRATKTAGRGVLVVTEVALAVVLVIGAGLLLKSFSRLMAVDVGLSTESVVAMSMKLPNAKYPEPSRDRYPNWPEVTNFLDALRDRLATVPGVRRSTIAANHPLQTGFTSSFGIVGVPEAEGPKDEARIRPVAAGYFETLGIPMLRGRSITANDLVSAPNVVVLNEAMARKYFPNEDPIGKKINHWGVEKEIVGVAKGELFGGPQATPEPTLYFPLPQLPMSELTLVIRTAGDSRAAIAGAREAIRAIDPEIALYDIEPLQETLGRTVQTPKFQAVLITSFGAIALLLAAIGLYALIAYQVQQRTNEIGVRLALGATRGEIARLVISRGAALALTGIAIGIAAAYAASRVLSSLLFNVSATDPIVYASVPVVLVVIALLASWLPARKAMKIEPSVALRYE